MLLNLPFKSSNVCNPLVFRPFSPHDSLNSTRLLNDSTAACFLGYLTNSILKGERFLADL